MELNKLIDHTLLKATATIADIETLCKEAVEYDFYSVSPRTPEGGQAGKGDKPLSLHILRSRGLPFKEGMW